MSGKAAERGATPGNTPPTQTGASTDRSRSQLDHMNSFFNDISADTPQYRQRLYELFSLIDKEFESLYLENCQLKVRLGQAPESSVHELVKHQDNSTAIFNELKSNNGKKSYQRQKWKSAFRGPPQRLVTSLKVGGIQGSESAKHCFVRSFEGHQDAVLSMACCSINNTTVIASASADQSVRLFDPDSGQCLAQYTGHNGAVNSVALKPDLSTNDQFFALSASGDRTVHLWRTAAVNDGIVPNSSEDDLDAVSEKLNEEDDRFGQNAVVLRQPLRIYGGHSDAVVGAEFLVGGDQLITVSLDRTAHIYDVENDTVLNVLTGHDGELTFCSSHKTSKIVATSSRDHTFRLWDFREAMRSVAVFQGHTASVNSVVFAATHHIISSSDDRTVKIWDLRNMRSPIASSRFESGVNKVGASAKSHLMAIPVDNRHVYIHDFNGNRIGRLHRGNSHTALVTSAIWVDESESNNLITAGIDKKVLGWRVNAKP